MSLLREWTTAALTADLADKLRADLFLVVAEVKLRDDTAQRADLLAMRRKMTHGPMLIVEIKTSRNDLLNDLRKEKWRGYLNDGAVTFAFPAGLADPSEIPTEAGVIIRIAQGWSWRRSPRWTSAPLPSPYLYRRMALSASDQSAERVRAQMTPRAADLWSVARQKRQENGRRLAEIASDVDAWRTIVQEEQAKFYRLISIKERLEAELTKLEASKRLLAREIAA
jgi:hypothetical protein